MKEAIDQARRATESLKKARQALTGIQERRQHGGRRLATWKKASRTRSIAPTP